MGFHFGNIYFSILGSLIKNGEKKKAKSILDSALFSASRKTGISCSSLLLIIFSKLNIFIEVRKIKSRHGIHMVPILVDYKRRVRLVANWLLDSAHADTRSVSMSEKLECEILSILSEKQSKSLLKKKLNTRLLLKNRSNVHFRW